MRDIRFAVLIGLILMGSVFAGRVYSESASVSGMARCSAYVPSDWGEYVGSGQYGIVFKDNEGTLRFFRAPACGHKVAPHVDLEIRRR